ncbi:MAG: type II secretion system protein GspG [Polyangiaceae bacterium]|nr:type II secretion system protein GspG [Polyangiaceae bacterium]
MRGIARFHRSRGRYPDSLNDLFAYDPLCERAGILDSYGNQFYYWQSPPSYELLSSGRDGIPGTFDDIYPGAKSDYCTTRYRQRDVEAEYLATDRGRVAVAPAYVSSLYNAVAEFHSDFNRYPASIAELFDTQRDDFVRTSLDPWGHPYWYRRIPSGFEVFSAGPDGLPKTADDLWPAGDFSRLQRKLDQGSRLHPNDLAPTTASGDSRGIHTAIANLSINKGIPTMLIRMTTEFENFTGFRIAGNVWSMTPTKERFCCR